MSKRKTLTISAAIPAARRAAVPVRSREPFAQHTGSDCRGIPALTIRAEGSVPFARLKLAGYTTRPISTRRLEPGTADGRGAVRRGPAQFTFRPSRRISGAKP